MPFHEDLSVAVARQEASERELRAAAATCAISSVRATCCGCAGLLLKFQNDEVFSEYFANRIWAVLRWFSCSSSSAASAPSTSCSGWAVWCPTAAVAQAPGPGRRGGGMGVRVAAQLYVFLIWLEERAAQKKPLRAGHPREGPRGVLAYLKYSRAMLPGSSSSQHRTAHGDDGAPRAPGRAAARRGIDSGSLSLQEARSLIERVKAAPRASAARTCTRGSQLVVADRLVHHARGQCVLRALAAVAASTIR